MRITNGKQRISEDCSATRAPNRPADIGHTIRGFPYNPHDYLCFWFASLWTSQTLSARLQHPTVSRKRKSVGNYKHISLVRGISRMPSGGRSGHHVGGTFCCPMRFDRSFQVFLFSCIGAVLAVSGLMSASQAGKYIKTLWMSIQKLFST